MRSAEAKADIVEGQPKTDPLRAQILGLENAVDAISDAEKPLSQRISERSI
jgi:hypothetical protein